VGAFHGKPASSVTGIKGPAAIAKKWGVTFPIALDRDWQTLRSWWIDGAHHRHATSVTFVIGKDGKVAHVHPGPVFFPSQNPEDAQANRDFLAMQKAIRAALAR
jgi:peroxiredoxin